MYKLQDVLAGKPVFLEDGTPVTSLKYEIGNELLAGVSKEMLIKVDAATGKCKEANKYNFYTDIPVPFFSNIYIDTRKRTIKVGGRHGSLAVAMKHGEDFMQKNSDIELINTVKY